MALSARDLCAALGGHWYGSYGLAFCPAHNNTRTPALSLSDGSDGRLLAYCHVGGTFADAMAALRTRGLIAGRGIYRTDPLAVAKRLAEDEVEQAKSTGWAVAIWRETD